jgi:universal stress protein A
MGNIPGAPGIPRTGLSNLDEPELVRRVPPVGVKETPMFSRILVPLDFSEPSDAALDYARELAAKFGSSLLLIHVVEGAVVTGPFGAEVFVYESPGVHAALVEAAERELALRIRPADRARFNARSEVVTGITAKSIVAYANACEADLIVMGTHGRSGLAHLLMGSVAEHVLRAAPCPVLTVRQARVRAAEPQLVAVATPA